MTPRAAAVVLAVVLAGGLWVSAGPIALLYSLLFAAAVLPGLPIGVAIFGRRHPAAWIGGALIGYGLTQLALWAVIAAGVAGTTAFLLAWAAAGTGAFLLCRQRFHAPAIVAPAWSGADVRALLLVLLIVPVLMGITYRNLGRADDSGHRYYRAYFTADFLWHSALASELGKFTMPPRNPYLAPRVMNYYWTYFLLPSVVAQQAPEALAPLDDPQRTLKANAMLVGLLMVGALFVLVRAGVSRPVPAVVAVMLAILAASAEGWYAIADLWSTGRPMSALLDTNVDAMTAWAFEGMRVDNMPRSLWYTPQHTTSIALGLTALCIAVLGGATATTGAIVGAGLALALATTMNPLLGAVCSLLYGVCVLADGAPRPAPISTILRHSLAAVFVVAAVGWASLSRVADGAGAALDIGFSGASRKWPVVTLLLSLGPVLVPSLPGLFGVRHEAARRSVVVAAAGIMAGLFLLYFVRVSEASWVGFRAGQVLLVTIPMLLARTFERLPRAAGAVVAGAVLIIGLPTTAIDTWNAQDIWNRRPGPGFRWTLWTTPDQQAAFAWIQRHTPPDAVVQMEPIVRGREHWTLLPSFAGRRMAAGLPISLLPIPEYAEKSQVVRQIFETADAQAARQLAGRLRLDYLYVDGDDLTAYPHGTAKFDVSPEYFEPVFRNPTVRVYRVR